MDNHACAGQRDALERWLHVKEEEHEDMLTEQIRADLYKKMDGPPAPVPTPVRSDRLPEQPTPASGNAPAHGVPQWHLGKVYTTSGNKFHYLSSVLSELHCPGLAK